MRLDLPTLVSAEPEELEIFDAVAKGNTKLGDAVYSFSLPAVVTCGRGSTALCRSLCYADRPQSRFNTPAVRNRYWANLALAARDDFHLVLGDVLGRLREPLFRWHVSGDFFDEAYAWKVLQVSRNSPHATMWLYTRAWRDRAISTVLAELASLPHVHVWYSCDRETGRPGGVPSRVRLAYMQVEHDDVPPFEADLYFRENDLRDVVRKHVGGTLICPAENGVSKSVTCDRCRVCLTDPAAEPRRRTKGRFPPGP